MNERLPDFPHSKGINPKDGVAPCQNPHAQQTASEVLLLLARELPKLVNVASSTAATSPSEESSRKRRRLNDEPETDFDCVSSDIASLPDSGVLEAVVAAYFRNVHPWIPLIHQGRLLHKLEDLSAHPEVLVILHSMTIAAGRFVPAYGASPTGMSGAHRKWVVYTAMESLSLENLQALIIIAWSDIGQGEAAKAWSIIGSLTRTVEYMQLTQEQVPGRHRAFCRPYASLRHTDDWTTIEERRRVFWIVFLLDRLCSVMMGWNTSLTSTDVHRRLPCDGVLWRKQTPVLTPFFGIWDKSKGSLGQPIGFESRRASRDSPELLDDKIRNGNDANSTALPSSSSHPVTDLSSIGALAYNIEATESMSRIMTHFLQQCVNLHDQIEIAAWLTRFKELDLRLVHWKMLLPQKWKANPNLTRQVPLMDPNLTTAHVTHNASMILLHQVIAYPPARWKFRNQLPSACSGEACYLSGIEIATISAKYLTKSLVGSPVSSQFAFCLFLAGRVLLVHWRYTPGNQLPSEFWSITSSLEEMSRRWNGQTGAVSSQRDVFTKYADRLKALYDLSALDQNFRIDVIDYTNDISYRCSQSAVSLPHTAWPEMSPVIFTNVTGTQEDWSSTLDFNFASDFMLDQDFMDMDRVITFDDGSMFTTDF